MYIKLHILAVVFAGWMGGEPEQEESIRLAAFYTREECQLAEAVVNSTEAPVVAKCFHIDVPRILM